MSQTLRNLITKARNQGSFASFVGDGREKAEWLIGPVGQTRDSDSISESNWRVVIREMRVLDPEEQDHEILRFGHFACGWVEEIATRPGSACAEYAASARKALDQYPILDDDDHSELEAEQVSANLPQIMSELRRDLIKEFTRRNAIDPSDDDMSEDEITDWIEGMADDDLDSVAHGFAIEERDGWQYFNVVGVADALVEKGKDEVDEVCR